MLCMGAVILLLSWLKHLAGGRVKRFLGHHQPVDSLGQRERAQQFEQRMHLMAFGDGGSGKSLLQLHTASVLSH